MVFTSTANPLTPAELEGLLAAAFAEASILVRDDTHLHVGHNQDVGHSGGHYKVRIVWAGFTGLTRLARHRAVQHVLRPSWARGQIHALTLQLLAPQEAENQA